MQLYKNIYAIYSLCYLLQHISNNLKTGLLLYNYYFQAGIIQDYCVNSYIFLNLHFNFELK